MATKNLVSKNIGEVKRQTGTGYPNHFAPKGSIYSDTDTGEQFKNIDSTDHGWIPFNKLNYGKTKTNPNKVISEKFMVLNQITDKEMFLIKKPEPGTLAFNIDRNSAVLFNGFKWVSLLNEELHPILFKDKFDKNKFSSSWSIINGEQKNFWTVGNVRAKTGLSSAYITNNGRSNVFSGSTSDSHIFFDIYIPKGIRDLRLYVDYLCGGTNDIAFGTISIAPVTYFPKAGTMIDKMYIKNAIYSSNTWAKAYSSLGKTFAGQNARIILSWHNEEIKNEMLALNIDNISLEYIK